MDRNIPECCSKLTAHKTPPCATTGPRTQDPGPSCSSVLRPDAFTSVQLKRNYNFLFVELLHASQHLWDKKPQCSLWGDTMFCPGCRSTLCVHSCSAFFSWTQLQTLTVSTGERLLTQECGQEFVREFYEAERRFWLAFDLWVFDLREIDLWVCVCRSLSSWNTACSSSEGLLNLVVPWLGSWSICPLTLFIITFTFDHALVEVVSALAPLRNS